MNIYDFGGDFQWNNTLNFVEIRDAALQLKWGHTHTHTHTHHDDVKSRLPSPPSFSGWNVGLKSTVYVWQKYYENVFQMLKIPYIKH
jgi:hypothetical protein